MNLMLLALAFLFLSQGNLLGSSPQKPQGQGHGFDANSIFSVLGKMNDGKGLDMQTILELMSNPAVAGILSSLLGKKSESGSQNETSVKEDKGAPFEGEKQEKAQEEKGTLDNLKEQSQRDERQEGNKKQENQSQKTQAPAEEFFSPKQLVIEQKEEKEKPIEIYSREEQEREEFFAPVAQIATTKVSKELYGIYDNWYNKKGR